MLPRYAPAATALMLPPRYRYDASYADAWLVGIWMNPAITPPLLAATLPRRQSRHCRFAIDDDAMLPQMPPLRHA